MTVKSGMEIGPSVPQATKGVPVEGIQRALGPQSIGWLEGRGIEPELALRYHLWSNEKKNGHGEILVFPFLRDGHVVNLKYRDLEEKRFWQSEGGLQVFWNEDALRDATLVGQPLIITEGEMDALSVIQAGFARTVSVPAGAPNEPVGDAESTKYQFVGAVRGLLALDRVPEIILAVDGDANGINLLHDLALRLGRYRCRWIQYPLNRGRTDRLKDFNEVLREYGTKGIVEVLSRARWLRVEGVYRLGELPQLADAISFPCGFPSLAANYRVRLGDLVIVTGIPGHGKTSWVNDLCCRLAWDHGLCVTFASFEQTPQRDHRRNLRTWHAGKPTTHMTAEEIADADRWIDEHFAFMVAPEEEDVTLDWLLDRLEVAVIQYGARVVVIDPWNELDHQRNRDESLTEYVGRAIKMLRRFARRLNVHLIIVAHPAKQLKDKDGNYRCPTLYDISDSANWYNKADVGIVVFRDGGSTLVRVAKTRYYDEIGIPGEAFFAYDFPSRRFQALDGEPSAGPAALPPLPA